jgi:hypothetical protein
MLFDDFMWDTMLAGEHILPFAAAGNEGNNDLNGIVSPATAKNLVTVGATERFWSRSAGSSPENMADFSSVGPTADGRIKPDVTATGLKVRVPLLENPDGSTCQTLLEPQGTSGTSYASPIAAGAAALIREYYLGGYYPGGVVNPSAALVKATIINSGRNMTGALTGGAIPGDKQGWGRITLDDALRFSDEPGSLQVIDDMIGLATGQQLAYAVQVPDDAEEWELKVTLVWTDWPGNPGAQFALVNDLDLTVSGPSGTYVGNHFLDGYSTSGGTADRRDVVEQVYLSETIGNLEPGTHTVTIYGYNVPFGRNPGSRQPFAVLVNLRPKVAFEEYLSIVRDDIPINPPQGYPGPTPTSPPVPYP